MPFFLDIDIKKSNIHTPLLDGKNIMGSSMISSCHKGTKLVQKLNFFGTRLRKVDAKC